MKNRIAFFVGQVFQDYQQQIVRVVTEEAIRLGYQIDVFSNFGTYGDNRLHVAGEKNIIELPYLENYNGIILAPDTFDIVGMYEALVIKIRNTVKYPVVSLRFEDLQFHNVIIDDQSAIEAVVEHFVEVHGVKKIGFMAGRFDLQDAHRRMKGYRTAMERYHLPITEHMIFYGDYWKYKGDEAADWFLSGEDGPPEAIICSNDYMAISLLEALRKRNVRVPEDIRITGFDNVLECKFSEPRITSIEVPVQGMGIEAVHLLDRLIHGETTQQNVKVPVTAYFEGTCGCPVSERDNGTQLLFEEMAYLQHAMNQVTFMNVDFEACNTIEELIMVAYKYSFNFQYDNIFLCLCDHSEDLDKMDGLECYTERMVLRAVLSRVTGTIVCDEPFLRKNLLPDQYIDPEKPLYIFPLHYKNHCMGYVAAHIREADTLKLFFASWIITLSNYLDKVRMYHEHHELMEFRQLSITDELTGLHNRREMEKIIQSRCQNYQRKQCGFYILSIDMDGLKNINDHYGHLEGDKALCQFSNILSQFCCDDYTVARMGGDEFTALVDTDDETYIKRIIDCTQGFIKDYNLKSHKPYTLSASIGYAKYDPNSGILDCIKRADDDMYSHKFKNRLSRSYRGDVED